MAKREAKDLLPADMVFAANVNKLRQRRGWSISDLASRLRDEGLENFHPTTVSRVEAGTRAVRVGEIPAFERALATTFPYLLTPFDDVQRAHELLLRMREFEQAWNKWRSQRDKLLALYNDLLVAQRALGVALDDLVDHEEEIAAAGWGKSLNYELDVARRWADLDVMVALIGELRGENGEHPEDAE